MIVPESSRAQGGISVEGFPGPTGTAGTSRNFAGKIARSAKRKERPSVARRIILEAPRLSETCPVGKLGFSSALASFPMLRFARHEEPDEARRAAASPGIEEHLVLERRTPPRSPEPEVRERHAGAAAR